MRRQIRVQPIRRNYSSVNYVVPFSHAKKKLRHNGEVLSFSLFECLITETHRSEHDIGKVR